jgi:hypothetical protein
MKVYREFFPASGYFRLKGSGLENRFTRAWIAIDNTFRMIYYASSWEHSIWPAEGDARFTFYYLL